jgi:uncharacterized repeat protein (TIGR03803 family)
MKPCIPLFFFLFSISNLKAQNPERMDYNSSNSFMSANRQPNRSRHNPDAFPESQEKIVNSAGQVPEGIYGITQFLGNGFFRFDPATGSNTRLPQSPSPAIFQGILGGFAPGNDGKFYGISSFGGSLNLGVIYSFDPVTGIQTPLVDLTGPNGANGTYLAGNNLVLASDNYFYGMTNFGGKNNAGTIFRFDPVNLTDTVLYSFETNLNTPYSGWPSQGFILASDGMFYGMLNGGDHNRGYIFQFDPLNAHFKPLFSFSDGPDRRGLENGLVEGNDGKIYGVVASGGTNNYGVIFSINLASFEYKVLYNMDYKSGATKGSLFFARDGNLYGLSFYGGAWLYGSFYRFNPNTNEMTICHTYDGDVYGSYGGNPASRIVQSSNGKLYYELGSFIYPKGIIVSYDPVTMKDTVASVLTDSTASGILLFQVQGLSSGVVDQKVSTFDLTVNPNPFASITTIKYKVTEPGFVSLKVFDVMGTEVANLVNERQPSGNHSAVWKAAGLRNGIYFCRLQSDSFAETKKIILTGNSF